MLTPDQAAVLARRHFDEVDADWNLLSALAATGAVDPDAVPEQTYRALTDYHVATIKPGRCACALRGQLCEIGQLREYARRRAMPTGRPWC